MFHLKYIFYQYDGHLILNNLEFENLVKKQPRKI